MNSSGELSKHTIRLHFMLNLFRQEEFQLQIQNGDTIARLVNRFLATEAGRQYGPYLITKQGNLLCVAMIDYQYQPLDYLLKPGEQLAILPWLLGG